MQAVILDFDGVIVDSHGIINRLFTKITREELGIDITEEEFAAYPGMRFEQRIQHIAQEKGLSIPPEKILQAINKGRFEYHARKVENTTLFPGAKKLLDELRGHGIKIALGTNGGRKTALKSLRMLGVLDYFDTINTFDDVDRPKPAPDIFLKSAKDLDTKPEDCIVVEDSAQGIKAAKNAGMKVIAVSTTEPESNLGEADLMVNTIQDLTVEKLESL